MFFLENLGFQIQNVLFRLLNIIVHVQLVLETVNIYLCLKCDQYPMSKCLTNGFL